MTVTRPYTRRTPGYRMSDEDAAKVRAQVPDEPIALAEGHLACEACGVAVHTSVVAETVGFPAVTPRWVCPPWTSRGASRAREVHDRAEEYVTEHPLLAKQIGPHLALERIALPMPLDR